MNDLKRKDFLKLMTGFLTVTGLAVIVTPIVGFFFPAKLEETPSEPVLVGTEDELPLEASVTVGFGRYPALVIHTSEGLRAYSAVCTHFACIVKWDPELGEIVCPCHEGYFDPLDGSVISGPPPTPLEEIALEVVDGKIYIGGEA
jgi:cytochrome b6-f complex iron-sulfur subunit